MITKLKKKYNEGIVIINVSYNNTIITLTDVEGNVLSVKSGGSLGFKGSKKKTAYAGQCVANEILKEINNFNIPNIIIKVKGAGQGRDSSIQTLLNQTKVSIEKIIDVTPIAYNGCRPSKKRKL